jgi:alanyl-tRNA synthetase
MVKISMHNKLAHTAEHAFIGSLQKILGSTIFVRKVEHRENDSSVIVKLPELDLETVLKAQAEVNSLIYGGRRIKTQYFETLSEARGHFPNLRANEERIRETNQPIRMVEIEGHDIAACAMDHASNLRECEFFLVTKTVRIGRDEGYEINFVVQNQAKKASMMLSQKLLNICQELGANINTVENTVKKLNWERKVNALKLRRLTIEYLANIKHDALDENGKVDLVQSVVGGLDDNEIRNFAGKMISRADRSTIILIVNIPEDNEDNASVVFARSQSLERIECNKLFNQYTFLGARGGGKPSFLAGVVSKGNAHHLMKKLITDIRNLL